MKSGRFWLRCWTQKPPSRRRVCPIGHTFGHKYDAGDAFGRIDVDSNVLISLGKVSRSHRTDRRLLDIHPNTTRRRISFMFIGAKGCRMRGVVRL